MWFDDEDEEATFTQWVARELGPKALAAFDEDGSLDDLQDRIRLTWRILNDFGIDGARSKAAHQMIERLVPNNIDVELWRDISLGKNVHLPASAQYGPVSKRVQPSDERARRRPRGNAYGKVHDKAEEPGQFIQRQGKAIVRQSAEIAKLDRLRREAEERLAELQSGLSTYATTCLLTEMRKATAPVFAMGPAWTILRAIAGFTGREKSPTHREFQTKRILVVCHALREHEEFEKELKYAILKVCHEFEAAIADRAELFSEFDGPHEYEEILKDLEWPQPKWRSE